MSKSSDLDRTVKLYLISAMDFDGYYDEGEALPETAQEKIDACHAAFNAEAGKWLTGKVGKQTAVKEWLQGLPSVVRIDYMNGDILDIAVRWGSLPKDYTESQADKILENWFNLLAAKLLQLFNGYRIPTSDKE